MRAVSRHISCRNGYRGTCCGHLRPATPPRIQLSTKNFLGLLFAPPTPPPLPSPKPLSELIVDQSLTSCQQATPRWHPRAPILPCPWSRSMATLRGAGDARFSARAGPPGVCITLRRAACALRAVAGPRGTRAWHEPMPGSTSIWPAECRRMRRRTQEPQARAGATPAAVGPVGSIGEQGASATPEQEGSPECRVRFGRSATHAGRSWRERTRGL